MSRPLCRRSEGRLSGARSGLFMEQIRIIKEMRTAERERGRTGVQIRPAVYGMGERAWCFQQRITQR